MSEWKVRSDVVGGYWQYRVFKICSTGKREHRGDYTQNIKAAKALANALNRKEQVKA